jgi:hypothetical protein
MLVLCAGQGRIAAARGLREGIDFVSYEQVPLGPGDLVYSGSEKRGWIDRRATDGEVLAEDGRNARS